MNLILAAYFFLHPFFVSMTDIRHNAKAKTLEVAVRIFTDDFEKALRANCKCKVDLINVVNKKLMDSLVNTYILQHVSISTENKKTSTRFLGFEKVEESTWAYFEISGINSLQQLSIANNLLLEQNKKQLNIVHLKTEQVDKTKQLDISTTSIRLL
jgi:hypothetical protein